LLIKELALEVGASQGKGSVIIQSVYVGGNAEEAGLRVGDRIVRFNGRNIKNVKQFESTVARAKPEANVKIQVIRDNKKIESIVIIGEGEMEGVTLPATRG
jgi:S1-C subfamily serine protease